MKIGFLCVLGLFAVLGAGLKDLPAANLFDQYVDHFDHFNNEKWKQRYWENDEYFDSSQGIVFLYIEGESRVTHLVSENSFIMTAAKYFKATVYMVEHRFYGDSQPKENWSLENISLLSHDQALSDLAYFISKKKGELSGKTKWVVIGGSYSGALSAWMRFKFPHLVVGSLASSGVVNPILDFYEFEEQIYRSALRSEGCVDNIQTFVKFAVNEMENGKTDIFTWMGYPDFEWDDFWFYYADIFVEAIQYGHRIEFCKLLQDQLAASSEWSDKLKALSDYGKTHRADPLSYAFKEIRKTEIQKDSGRQWTYQYCSSLAYFNTPGRFKALRWKNMGIEYWKRYCQKSFNSDSVFPNTLDVKSRYADVRVQNYTSNVFFTNGAEDPWQWAGIRYAVGKNVESYLIDFPGAGHCSDLHDVTDHDPEDLTKARNAIIKAIEKWINQANLKSISL